MDSFDHINHPLVQIYAHKPGQINLELGNSAITHYFSIEEEDLKDETYFEAIEFSILCLGYALTLSPPVVAAILDRKQLFRVGPCTTCIEELKNWQEAYYQNEKENIISEKVIGYDYKQIKYFDCDYGSPWNTMIEFIDDKVEYTFKIENQEQAYWMVRVMQAYRDGQEVAVKVNEPTKEIIDLKKRVNGSLI